MVKFIPVRYQSFNYPEDFEPQPKIQEVTCNLGTENLDRTTCLDFLSLHTDPSIVWDKWPKKKEKIRHSVILSDFKSIFDNFKKAIDSKKNCVSMLWLNEQWSKEFAGFLVKLTEGKGIKHNRIKIIEIHSPFDTYCKDLKTFLERYLVFEKEILKSFPAADIVIENQYTHKGKQRFGNFLLSDKDHIIELSKLISGHESKPRIRIVLDIPQLFSTYYGNRLLVKSEIEKFLTPLKEYRHFISSTHIWGYDINKERGAHGADFKTWFNNDEDLKKCFLEEIRNLFDDGKKRYFVPEVSGTANVRSIVNDLIGAGFKFVDPE